MSEPQNRQERTRIKFCGITRLEDARTAAELGVDAIGFVFVPQSKRYVRPEIAAAIRRGLPPLVSVVALFQNSDAATVRAVIEQVRPDLLQFHGNEDARFCEQFGLPYMKAVSMEKPENLISAGNEHRKAHALLLDSQAGSGQGGTGQSFNWAEVPPSVFPLVLAGGLTPDNVARGIRLVRPYAVDVSSGIENDSPGVKDPERMREFVRAVRSVERPPIYTLSLAMLVMAVFLWLLLLLT